MKKDISLILDDCVEIDEFEIGPFVSGADTKCLIDVWPADYMIINLNDLFQLMSGFIEIKNSNKESINLYKFISKLYSELLILKLTIGSEIYTAYFEWFEICICENFPDIVLLTELNMEK